jgi:DNA-binding MarR family transcriptional regulator
MSTTQIGAALEVSADLSPTERLVLIQLAHFADHDGMAFTSVDNLAEHVNVSSNTITRAVRRLIVLGLVQRLQHRDVAGMLKAFHVTLAGPGAQGTLA